MNTRRITVGIGASVGGMLAAALVPAAAAHADDGDAGYFGFTVPDDALTADSGFPPLFADESADGVSLGYDAADDHSGVLSNADFDADGQSGTIDADVDDLSFTPLGLSSQTITLNDDLTTDGVGAEDGDTVAGEGSVFNVTDLGFGFGNVYADAVGAGDGGSNEVSDLLVTPLGSIDLSPIVGGLFEVDAADTVGDSGDIDFGGDLTDGIFGDEGVFSGFDVGSALIGGLLGGLVTGSPDAALISGLLGGVLGGGDDDGLLDGAIGVLLGAGDLFDGGLGDGLGDLLGGDLLGGDLLGGGLGDLLGGIF